LRTTPISHHGGWSFRDSQFCGLPLSPYKKPGEPNSGLFPEIALGKGKVGDGDSKIQAYNFRMYLSNKDDKLSFPKPAKYDASRYALLARFLNAEPEVQWTLNYTVKPMTDGPVQMRNGDSNNAGSFSSDYVAYGSIRMEPVFMILGQSAGVASSIAIDDAIAVQDVAYEKLQKSYWSSNSF
jgi:hypothetical protein